MECEYSRISVILKRSDILYSPECRVFFPVIKEVLFPFGKHTADSYMLWCKFQCVLCNDTIDTWHTIIYCSQLKLVVLDVLKIWYVLCSETSQDSKYILKKCSKYIEKINVLCIFNAGDISQTITLMLNISSSPSFFT